MSAISSPDLPAREALRSFREANGLCDDEHGRVWKIPIDFVTLYLPNFRWRREALAAHDLHHLLTGYPCTVKGELLIAAWEFGAGSYPHWGATLFCLPLALTGLLWFPREAVEAFRRGRRSRSLFAAEVRGQLAVMRLSEVEAVVRRGL